MDNKPYLSVIIPVYNECSRKGLEFKKNLEQIGKYLGEKGFEYEVIIVDDGSTDDSSSQTKKMLGLVKNLYIIERRENRGKWFSVREGFKAAKGKFKLFTDADGSTSIENMEKFWKYLEGGKHVIIGSRDLHDSKIEKHQPKWKELVGHLGSTLTRLIIGLPNIKDTQCGFKILSETAADRLIPLLTIDRWGGDFELLILSEQMGYEVIEVPIAWVDAGNSLVNLRGYLNTFRELLQVKWKILTNKYNLK